MKKSALFLFTFILLTVADNVRAQGTTFTYQGQLQNNGSPASGLYNFEFSLFNAATNGSQVGATVTNSGVGVTNGLFMVLVDFGSNVFTGSSNWLQIAVATNGSGTFTNLTPRQQVTPTPYAIYTPNAGAAASAGSVAAANIVGSITPSQVLGGAITNNQTGVNISGTFSGNGAGITNVALASLNSGGALSFNSSNGVYAVGATLSGAGAMHVAVADLNGDGLPDLVCGGNTGFTIYTNNGHGGFGLFSTINCGQINAGIAAVDLNGDGKVDLVGAPFNSSAYFLVFTNNGTGGFSLASSNNTGIIGIYSLAVGDVNGDGKMDVLVGGVASGATAIYTNNGNGGFVSASGFGGSSASPYAIVLADVDGNGSQDIIEMQYAGVTAPSKFVVITNNGTGGFSTPTPYLTGTNATSLAAADVNGDGWVDVITANTAANSLGIYTNNHSGGFTLASTVPVGIGPVSVIAKDLTGDGKPDLISANSDGTLSILVNNGSGGFTLASSPAVGGSPQSVIATNLNNDAQIELITANSGATTLSLLFNVSNGFTGTFTGNGSGLTNVLDTTLSANVALLNRTPQNFTGINTFTASVGIGTTTPEFPLDLAATLGDKLSLYSEAGGNGYGFGITNGLLQIHSDQLSSDIAIGYGPSTNFTERMRIRGNGNVGIGTNTPAATLEVNGNAQIDGTLSGNGAGLTNIFNVINSASTSGTVTAVNSYQSETIYLSSASTISSITIALPTTTVMGQVFRLHSKSAVTTLSVTGGSFVDAGVTSLTAGGNVTYQAVTTSGAYIRLQ